MAQQYQHVTLVFALPQPIQIGRRGEWPEGLDKLIKSMGETLEDGSRVTAVSMGDLVTECNELEERLDATTPAAE